MATDKPKFAVLVLACNCANERVLLTEDLTEREGSKVEYRDAVFAAYEEHLVAGKIAVNQDSLNAFVLQHSV